MQDARQTTDSVTAIGTGSAEAAAAQARSTLANKMDGNAFAGWDGALRLTRHSAEGFGASTKTGLDAWRDANTRVFEWWSGMLRDSMEAVGATARCTSPVDLLEFQLGQTLKAVERTNELAAGLAQIVEDTITASQDITSRQERCPVQGNR